jgi:hypothetical protein
MGYSATGKGLSDSDSRRSSSGSSKSGSSGSSGSSGRPDKPGEAEQKMRDAGVSESDIQRATGSSYGTPYHGSSGSGSSSGGRPDRPGEAEQKMRAAGVSEQEIRSSTDGGRRTRPGMPDLPGEATQKMIEAGVMTPGGEYKTIVGHYESRDGRIKFLAEGEPLPTFQAPPTAKSVSTTPISEKESVRDRISPIGLMPWYDRSFTSGTAFQQSVFDPQPQRTLSTRFSNWYSRQKTLIGMGGEREAKEYTSLTKQYELSQFTGLPFDTSKLTQKYAEYEKARGVSPFEGSGMKPRSTLAHKAHLAAEDIRSDRPTYGGWQGDLSRIINEGIASNIEFMGSVPSMVRHGVPRIAKDPGLIVPLGVVAGGEMIRSLREDPIQTIVTMGMTGSVMKGAGKIGSAAPRPYIKPSTGSYGITSPSGKFSAVIFPKMMEWRVSGAKGVKSGKILTSAADKALKSKIDRSIKTPIDFNLATYRSVKLGDIKVPTKSVKVSTKPIKTAKVSQDLIMGKTPIKPVKRYGLKDVSKKFIEDIDPKHLKVVIRDSKTVTATKSKPIRRYGLKDVPEEFIKDIDPKHLKVVRRDSKTKIATKTAPVRKFGLRDVPEEFIKDIDPKFLKPVKIDKFWKSKGAQVSLTELRPLQVPKISSGDWASMGKSREIAFSYRPRAPKVQYRSKTGIMSHVSPKSKMDIASMAASGIMVATKYDQDMLTRQQAKDRAAEKLKYGMSQYTSVSQLQKVGVLSMQGVKYDQMIDQIMKTPVKPKVKTVEGVLKTVSVKTPIRPKEKVINIPIPGLAKKDKKKKRTVKKSKVRKQDIKNPIASVDKFMRQVI